MFVKSRNALSSNRRRLKFELLETRVVLDGDALEPNNSFGTAADLGSLGDLVVTELSIHEPDDDDYFRLTAASTGQYEVAIFFTNAFGDVDLEVYDDSFGLIEASASTDDTEQVDFAAFQGQNYFIRVFGFGGDTNPDYELTIDGPGIPPDARESNNNFGSASNLGTLGDLVIGDLSIHVPDDDDYFRFTAASNGSIEIRLDFEHDQGDVDLAVYGSSLQQIDSSTSTADSEVVSITAVQGQTYYIHAYGFGVATNPAYELTIDGPGSEQDAHEPNDSFATAANLGTVGDLVIDDLSIHIPNNNDYFRLTVAVSGQLRVSLFFVHASGDVDLTVYNAAQQVIGSSSSVINREYVAFSAIQGQTYYIRAFGFSGAVNPDYSLMIDAEAPAGDYDDDGDVDGTDFLTWQRSLGATGQSAADGNGDELVDAVDLHIWQTQFGVSFTPLAAAASSPATEAAFTQALWEQSGVASELSTQHKQMRRARPEPDERRITIASQLAPPLPSQRESWRAVDQCFGDWGDSPKKRLLAAAATFDDSLGQPSDE